MAEQAKNETAGEAGQLEAGAETERGQVEEIPAEARAEVAAEIEEEGAEIYDEGTVTEENEEQTPEETGEFERSMATYAGSAILAGGATWRDAKLSRTFSVSRAAIDEDARTVQVAFSSEHPVERGWGVEVLDHGAGSVRDGRLRDGAPLLLEHDPAKHIGVVEEINLGDDRVARASVRFGNSALAQEVFQDVKDGVKRHISVGYVIHEVRKEKTDQDEEIWRAVDWEPLEISWVSIPADPHVGIGRSASQEPTIPEEEITVSEIKTDDVQDVRAAELARIKDIESLGAAHRQGELARKFIESGKSVDEFRAAVLEQIRLRPVEKAEVGMSAKEVKRYSLTKVLRHMADPTNKRLAEEAAFELEASAAAEKVQGRAARGVIVPFDVLQKRDISTASGSAGGYLVADEHQGNAFIDVLSDHSVVFPLTTKLTGIQGDISIPKMSAGSTAAFVANEAAAVSESTPTFAQVALSPETCGTFVDIGRKLFHQADPSVDRLIMGDLARALAVKLDATILNGSGSSGEPTGILNLSGGVNTVSHGTNGGAETWATIVEYEELVRVDNAQGSNMVFVMTPGTVSSCKTIEKASNTARFLIENGEANGYRVLTSNNLPTDLTKGTGSSLHGVVFGDFTSCIVAMWGGLDLTMDPYTLSSYGAVRLVGLQDLDIGFRHEQAFAISVDTSV